MMCRGGGADGATTRGIQPERASSNDPVFLKIKGIIDGETNGTSFREKIVNFLVNG